MSGEIVLYNTEDGQAAFQLKADRGSVWLTQVQLADLFETTVSNINKHIKAIIEEGEQPEATIEQFSIVQTEGARSVTRQVAHYALPMILAVGFRVRSPRGAQFRRWASTTLAEYLVKGFAMDDARLKDPEVTTSRNCSPASATSGRQKAVLQEGLGHLRRHSVDYDGSAEASQLFFQTVQNKMHWAAHGHTAAEIIAARADATKDNMGLTSWANQSKGGAVRKSDVATAKNYLNEEEIEALNRIVTAYLEFAELQAMARKPMTMRDWIAKLDDFCGWATAMC
jgi:hypothetical protein